MARPRTTPGIRIMTGAHAVDQSVVTRSLIGFTFGFALMGFALMYVF